MEPKRQRGAPKGNQNAVKHGYYSRKLAAVEKHDYEFTAGMQGVEEEITLLRFEIKKAISGGDIKNLIPLTKAALALEKLIRTHHQFFAEKQDNLKAALRNVIRDVIIPFGPDIFEKVKAQVLSDDDSNNHGFNQKTNLPPK
jgi:hypothetical protein